MIFPRNDVTFIHPYTRKLRKNMSVSCKQSLCNKMKLYIEKNFTCEFAERHNSKLTSLLSSSGWLWICFAMSCICLPKQSCPLTLKVIFFIYFFRYPSCVLLFHVIDITRRVSNEIYIIIFLPSGCNLRLVVHAYMLLTLHRHCWRTDKDPTSFYLVEFPILSTQIQVKLISNLNCCHKASKRPRILLPFENSHKRPKIFQNKIKEAFEMCVIISQLAQIVHVIRNSYLNTLIIGFSLLLLSLSVPLCK